MFFFQGQQVEATVSAQGMKLGEHLVVDEVFEDVTAFGTFTTLVLVNHRGKQVTVRNPSLVLREVSRWA